MRKERDGSGREKKKEMRARRTVNKYAIRHRRQGESDEETIKRDDGIYKVAWL